MAGTVLLQHAILILVVYLLNGARAESYSDRCRKDLAQCMSYGGFACQGGGDIRCRQTPQRCNGISECPWGEDEINCGRRMRPRRTSFFTRTIVRTSTTTQTKTSTSTQSTTVTSTEKTTSVSTSVTSTSTTSTPTYSLPESRVTATATVTSVLPAISAATFLNSGEVISGGSTCTVVSIAAGVAFMVGEFRIMKMSSSVTITGAATASCSPTTTTVW